LSITEASCKIEKILQGAAASGLLPASQICIVRDSEVILSESYGYVPVGSKKIKTQKLTLFDLASVTKLFTATAFMRLVDLNLISLEDTVSGFLPEFSGRRPIAPYEDPLNPGKLISVNHGFMGTVEAGEITFRQLLRHSSGLPAWRPLFTQPTFSAAKQMVFDTFFSYEPDTDVVYSDLGFMLVGWAIEKVCDMGLDQAIDHFVLKPLQLTETGFRPLSRDFNTPLPLPAEGIAPTGICAVRHKFLVGEVNDENCACLGGISGHAGLFTTAEELATFGQSFLDESSILSLKSMNEMKTVQAVSRDGLVRRGIGFQLWSADPNASYAALSPDSFGHTGFTGTCLWIDPQRQMVVAFLTNEVSNGRKNRKILPLRSQILSEVAAIFPVSAGIPG